jgi:hypothetical protein
MNPRLIYPLLALLAGCATPSVAPPAGTPGAGAPPAGTVPAPEPLRPGQPAPTALAAEVRWMQALFDGTPVQIVAETDGAMRVDVPMVHAFDEKSATPKPPLHAVMDKVATTMGRQASSKVHIATPGPAARSTAMRSYLATRGVIALRVVVAARPAGEWVTLRVVPGPSAIDRLDDRSLPPPTGAFPASRTPPRAAP